jgi:hypothetical protein
MIAVLCSKFGCVTHKVASQKMNTFIIIYELYDNLIHLFYIFLRIFAEH